MDDEIRFYRAAGEFAWLSNLYQAPIDFEGRGFPSAEHAYQYGKFVDGATREWAMQAPTATLCAQLAHALLPWQVVPNWSLVKVERMRAVLRAKFGQHPELGMKLIDTGDAVLVEESKTDAFWGTGKKGTGKNMLGALLAELRAELRGDRS